MSAEPTPPDRTSVSVDERRARRVLLRRAERIRHQILKRRGGVPLDAATVDEELARVRGGDDA